MSQMKTDEACYQRHRRERAGFLALVDCATHFILGWTLADSARATQALIKRVCQTWGIFNRLYPDNGSALAGHLVAGGALKRLRNSGAKMAGVKPLGICHHLGIAVHFALPGNGQAKTVERTFASLSRVLDDRPEFKGAPAGHRPELKGAPAGHRPGAAPDCGSVPVSVCRCRSRRPWPSVRAKWRGTMPNRGGAAKA